MMNCIIIEDQLPAQRILKKYIADIGSLDLVGTYSNAIDALEVLKSKPIDLMFLDIHLPKISGIDFLKSLKEPPQVILTTAFQEFAIEGYELNVVDYLLKPFSFQRFLQAISKVRKDDGQAINNLSEQASAGPSEIFLKSGYDLIRVVIADIIYLRSDTDYTEVHLSEKKHLSSETLKQWEDRLDGNGFARVHKSYLINVSKIHKISGNRIMLVDGIEIPIGRAYKNDFIARYVK